MLPPALAVALALAALPTPSPGGGDATAERGQRVAKHVILVIGDGMSRATEIMASRYLGGEELGLAWHGFEYQGYSSTWDVTTFDRFALARGAAPFREEDARGPIAPERAAIGFDPGRGGEEPWAPGAKVDQAEQSRYFQTALPLDDTKMDNVHRPATDSAAAATALATGMKTLGGRVAWHPREDQGRITTLAEELRASYRASIGVVSTVPITHATPAAFVAHAPSRESYAAISEQILGAAGPDVAIGGGHPGFHDGPGRRRYRYFPRSAYDEVTRGDTGWRLVERKKGQRAVAALCAAAADTGGRRLLGLFGGSDGSFSGDCDGNAVPAAGSALECGSATAAARPSVPPASGARKCAAADRAAGEDPTLAQAVEVALIALSRNENGFLLVVEQGDIDWAAHGGDIRRAIDTTRDLDEAVRRIVAFVDRPGDGVAWENTVVVVTADHANGHLRLLARSPRGVVPREGEDFTWGKRDPRTGSLSHTNELVTLAARGAGAKARFEEAERRTWYPGTRIVDNTQVHAVLRAMSGL
jgi:alkaline phosphatase